MSASKVGSPLRALFAAWLILSSFAAAGICRTGNADLPEDKNALMVMTFNIRYDNRGDGPDAWAARMDKVASTIDFFGVDAVGLQEALLGQIRDLEKRLPGYGWFGVGREDGKEEGEFCPVFYRKARLKPLGRRSFWLSEGPEGPGVAPGWDGACRRIVTVVEFRDLRTGKRFFFYNTHFDHVGETARAEAARLVLRDMNKNAGRVPVILTGDLNCGAGSVPYRILTSGNDGGGPALTDTRAAALAPLYGARYSFNAFSREQGTGGPIDHILMRDAGRVRRWGVIAELWDGHFASDHFPVMAEIIMDRR